LVSVLVSVELIDGAVSAFSLPAGGAFPRVFFDDARLARALSLTGTVVEVAGLAGAPLGGVVVVALGLSGAAGLDLASFVLVGVVLLVVRPPYERRGETEPDAETGGDTIAAGLRAVRAVPGVLPLLGAVTVLAGGLLPLLGLLVPLAAHDRGWQADQTGLVETAWIAGCLTVSLLVARFGAQERPVGPMCVGTGLAALGAIGIAAMPWIWSSLAAAYVMGLGTTLFTGHVFPTYLLQAPEQMVGRFQALLVAVQTGGMVVGNLALGWLGDSLGPADAMLVVAGACGAAILAMLANKSVRGMWMTTGTRVHDTAPSS
jgi:MFS family permease